MDVGLEHDGGVRMPEIVKPDARQFGRRQEPIPGMADRIGLLRHDLPSGKALGSYETWAEWCRDPLLALGCRDPVDRIAEIKEADPRRRALVAVLDAWWEKHGDTTLKSKDLDPVVIELIDLRASRKADGSLQYNRQRVARFLTAHAGTRLGGYFLEQTKDHTLTRPLAYYRLQRDGLEPAMEPAE